IARGLIHDPPVLFLDEPTIGVDPVGARELRAIIASLRDAGKTILLTTHYMFEADSLCQRIAVITAGQIVAQGTPRELKTVVADRSVVEVEAYGVPAAVVERLRGLSGVTSVAIEDRDQAQLISVHSDRGANLTQVVVAQLDGVRVERVSTREPTLEDAYIALVTRR
ncbi:MAG TPA: ABC transporter ATP-binding protein, partial [Candidatus Dormibacteraeota bacterium]|nr:ABC transporter ATP-binding protein [Candidatus Dormibacteraeota bacterium]